MGIQPDVNMGCVYPLVCRPLRDENNQPSNDGVCVTSPVKGDPCLPNATYPSLDPTIAAGDGCQAVPGWLSELKCNNVTEFCDVRHTLGDTCTTDDMCDPAVCLGGRCRGLSEGTKCRPGGLNDKDRLQLANSTNRTASVCDVGHSCVCDAQDCQSGTCKPTLPEGAGCSDDPITPKCTVTAVCNTKRTQGTDRIPATPICQKLYTQVNGADVSDAALCDSDWAVDFRCNRPPYVLTPKVSCEDDKKCITNFAGVYGVCQCGKNMTNNPKKCENKQYPNADLLGFRQNWLECLNQNGCMATFFNDCAVKLCTATSKALACETLKSFGPEPQELCLYPEDNFLLLAYKRTCDLALPEDPPWLTTGQKIAIGIGSACVSLLCCGAVLYKTDYKPWILCAVCAGCCGCDKEEEDPDKRRKEYESAATAAAKRRAEVRQRLLYQRDDDSDDDDDKKEKPASIRIQKEREEPPKKTPWNRPSAKATLKPTKPAATSIKEALKPQKPAARPAPIPAARLSKQDSPIQARSRVDSESAKSDGSEPYDPYR